ncbi:nucleotide pyrophosphohydrolase [Adhaeribacter rhizoryzae]|uniref:Nucleotide pyrophosphohydrolase n=1 Tax=Adhaeribacter rhizoryzae TaxID=2607907 RepID=A0A5M6CWU3_9BACT|nr:nucleotide pyrophosphohydrolase [Adhaeribacter rhizoryzae]KAA5538860.1 nucleotide pyrophosphohydrolase [Adhaeribacter rhizoryzae]
MENKDLIKKIIAFREERNWEQFHSIKDLCLGLSIEVSELQEFFLWKTNEQINSIKIEKKEHIADELADIFIFLAYLSNDLGIDLDKAIVTKIDKNDDKYPIEKSRGSNKKYNEL